MNVFNLAEFQRAVLVSRGVLVAAAETLVGSGRRLTARVDD